MHAQTIAGPRSEERLHCAVARTWILSPCFPRHSKFNFIDGQGPAAHDLRAKLTEQERSFGIRNSLSEVSEDTTQSRDAPNRRILL